MINKHLLRPERLRHIPPSFSWVDHRLVRHAVISSGCDHRAWALYLFLVTVADAQGLSYYSDAAIGRRLTMDLLQLAAARAAIGPGRPDRLPQAALPSAVLARGTAKPAPRAGGPRTGASPIGRRTSCAALWKEARQ